jgi:Na+-driven multidrug efflux pump
LCFGRAWGVVGLWAGLCLSLVLIGAVLIAVWQIKARRVAGS